MPLLLLSNPVGASSTCEPAPKTSRRLAAATKAFMVSSTAGAARRAERNARRACATGNQVSAGRLVKEAACRWVERRGRARPSARARPSWTRGLSGLRGGLDGGRIRGVLPLPPRHDDGGEAVPH